MQVFSPIFHYIDGVTTDFVAHNISSVILGVTPVVAAAMSCVLAIEGVMTMLNPNGEPLSALMQKFLRWGIILSVASTGGMYQHEIAAVILKVPDDFANLLILSNSTDQAGATASTALDTALTEGWKATKTAFKAAGVMSGGGLAALAEAICLAITTVFLCAGSASSILFAKIMLAICVCLGPIAIFCLLFKATSGIFGRWTGVCLNYGLVTVMLSATFGLFEHLFKMAIDRAQTPGDGSLLAPTLTCGIIAVITLQVIKQIPGVAARLGDGIQLAAPSLMEGLKSASSGLGMTGRGANTKAVAELTQAIKGAAGGPAGVVASNAANVARGLARGSSR